MITLRNLAGEKEQLWLQEEPPLPISKLWALISLSSFLKPFGASISRYVSTTLLKSHFYLLWLESKYENKTQRNR